MSKMKLALDVVSDLRALAESIEDLVKAIEGADDLKENENLSKSISKENQIEQPSKKDKKLNESISAEENIPTLEEIRAVMAQKSRNGHRKEVKGIITKYGAKNLSSLDKKYYKVALKEAGAL